MTVHSVTVTVLYFSDSVNSKAYNNQSCKHCLKLNGQTVTVTDADGHCLADGRSVIRAADEQWWTVTIMVVDGWNWTRTKLERKRNQKERSVTVTSRFSLKSKDFNAKNISNKSHLNPHGAFYISPDKVPWATNNVYHGSLGIIAHGILRWSQQ